MRVVIEVLRAAVPIIRLQDTEFSAFANYPAQRLQDCRKIRLMQMLKQVACEGEIDVIVGQP